MTTRVEQLLEVAEQLSQSEKLELIQALSQSLLRYYQPEEIERIPSHVQRTAPVADLASLAADFWPEDETADDVNDFIAQQRREDRLSDL
jgi:hypothetical protein